MILLGFPRLGSILCFLGSLFLATGGAPHAYDLLGRLRLVGPFRLCNILGLLLGLSQPLGHLLREKGIVLVDIAVSIDIVVGHNLLARPIATTSSAGPVRFVHGVHGLGVEIS